MQSEFTGPPETEIYKVCSVEEWQRAVDEGQFVGSEADRQDGFIHFSRAHQLDETVRKHFPGDQARMLLIVDVKDLGDQLRWEVSRGGQLFPHLFAPLQVADVRTAVRLERDERGHVRIPT